MAVTSSLRKPTPTSWSPATVTSVSLAASGGVTATIDGAQTAIPVNVGIDGYVRPGDRVYVAQLGSQPTIVARCMEPQPTANGCIYFERYAIPNMTCAANTTPRLIPAPGGPFRSFGNLWSGRLRAVGASDAGNWYPPIAGVYTIEMAFYTGWQPSAFDMLSVMRLNGDDFGGTVTYLAQDESHSAGTSGTYQLGVGLSQTCYIRADETVTCYINCTQSLSGAGGMLIEGFGNFGQLSYRLIAQD